MTLANYLHEYLGGLSAQLGWTTSGSSYNFPVSETLRYYGVSTEDEATDLTKLYALGKVALWETVLREVSFDYDYTANGASFKRSQQFEFIKQSLEDAKNEASYYLGDYKISTGTLGGDEVDPYSNYPYEDR